MAITWGDAVADIDNAGDGARYDRAVAQAVELNELVRSFMVAVAEAGKWPMTQRGEYDNTLVPSLLQTAFREPLVSCWPDGSWVLDVAGLFGYLVKFEPGKQPNFYGDRSTAIADPEFDARMAAMDDSKNWVPRALVAYLRREGIDIPTDQ